MQLVAYGAQDIYLTGNPQITFFKVVYRRHTNFSMEAIEQTWNGSAEGDSGRCTATISRNGDLVHRMYLQIDNSQPDNHGRNPGASMIENVELEIGGQSIDKHSGLWMETWAELTEPNPTGQTFLSQTSSVGGTLFQKMSLMGGVDVGDGNTPLSSYFIPLQFWFCRNPGLALPLIALQYHEVKVILDHKLETFMGAATDGIANRLFCDYIYLDTDERRRFAQVSHEYLIEQVQTDTITAGTGDLNFNHPVKELIWVNNNKVLAAPDATGPTTNLPIGDGSGSTPTTYQIKLNGHDRFQERDFRYFSRVQVWQHHSGAGGLDVETNQGVPGAHDDSIGVYSFALKPEEHQPSGTCNFSRIDNARLEASDPSSVNTVFAVNYNVLRIMSGMGGLAYSN